MSAEVDTGRTERDLAGFNHSPFTKTHAASASSKLLGERGRTAEAATFTRRDLMRAVASHNDVGGHRTPIMVRAPTTRSRANARLLSLGGGSSGDADSAAAVRLRLADAFPTWQVARTGIAGAYGSVQTAR